MLDLSSVGTRTSPTSVSWSSTQAIIYALGVGAGSEDPSRELEFTTENTDGLPQQVLPTFAMVIGSEIRPPSYGNLAPGSTLHAEQELNLFDVLPPNGEGILVRSIDHIYDKGEDALVVMSAELTNPKGKPLARSTTTAFVRGGGGFGGRRGPKAEWTAPTREADRVIKQPTRKDQALLYRLSGDRNPLHSDPSLAKKAGLERPILHGLCTFGFVSRATLAIVDQDLSRLLSISARFASPVMPGETLSTYFWIEGARITFRTYAENRLILDHGRAEVKQ